MGIVRMIAPEGEMLLRRYGKGGKDGLSALDNPDLQALPEDSKDVRVHVEGRATRNFTGRTQNE